MLTARPPVSRRSRGLGAAVGAVGVAAFVEAFMLSRHPAWFQTLDGWFYFPLARPLGPSSAWLVLAAAALATCVALAGPRAGEWRRLTVVAVAGVGMIVGFALIEGRGLMALRDRVLHAGHSEFARTAASGVSVHDVLHRYEALVSSGRFGAFERTKPPGTLLFYVLTERLGHALLPFPTEIERLDWLATFATFTWPALSMVSLAPLFVVGRVMADAEQAIGACALAIVVPSFLLVTMHTDQVLFPLLVNATLACATLAAHRNDALLGACGGVLGYLAVFCSFGLVCAAPVVLACVVLGAAARRSSRAPSWRSSLRALLAFSLGAAMSAGLARVVLGYDLARRYDVAVRAHLAWKGWKGSEYEITHFAWLNSLEFVLWIGAPLALFAVVGAVLGVVDAARTRRTNVLLLATVLVATVALLACLGRTKAETARLWLFLAQPLCLAVTLTLHRLFPRRAGVVLAAMWLAQFVIVLDIKRFQDFY